MPDAMLTFELLSDVAFTASNASIGRHETLRYIPGSAVLGACAQALYHDLSPELAGRIFHSDSVRFGCARPVMGNVVTVPVPLSYHCPKNGSSWQRLASDLDAIGPDVTNLAAADRTPELKQLRTPDFLDAGLRRYRPLTGFSMRTAIGDEGRVRDGYLFSIEALSAGQVFRSWLHADRDDDLDRLVTALGGRDIRLGRSRNTEFGLARVVAETGPCADGQELGSGQVRQVALLLLSDLCLRDTLGHPTVVPTSRHVGLPDGWRLDVARTFAGTRSYSPFNAKRRRHDHERHVLSMGSVLVFAGETEVDLNELRASLAGGIGMHRNEGLGQVLVAPMLLGVASPNSLVALEEDQGKPTSAPIPERDELALWMRHRADVARAAELQTAEVARTAWELGALVSNAQWGEVRTLASRALAQAWPFQKLEQELRTLVTSGVGQLATRWGRKLKRAETVGDVFMKALAVAHTGNGGDTARWVLDLATHAMRVGPRGSR